MVRISTVLRSKIFRLKWIHQKFRLRVVSDVLMGGVCRSIIGAAPTCLYMGKFAIFLRISREFLQTFTVFSPFFLFTQCVRISWNWAIRCRIGHMKLNIYVKFFQERGECIHCPNIVSPRSLYILSSIF